MERAVALIERALADGLGSGAALSVGDGGREVFRAVRGTDRLGGAAIDQRAWFDLASLTKPMATAALAMALVSEGLLDLDMPVAQWLACTTTGTVRHLLGHAAGCAAHVEFWKRGEMTRESIIAMAGAEPAELPGVDTVYSDLGYLLLGAVLERAAGLPLEEAVAKYVTGPLELQAQYGPIAAGAVETEGVRGVVHDENARFSGGICGHAGLFGTIGDVGAFAANMVSLAKGVKRGRISPDTFAYFTMTSAAPHTSWRLGWDTPSATPGVSHAGEKWPREGAIGHLGFTGTSMWLDLPRGRWCVLLTNRVHPSRENTADAIKQLRRDVADAVSDELLRE